MSCQLENGGVLKHINCYKISLRPDLISFFICLYGYASIFNLSYSLSAILQNFISWCQVYMILCHLFLAAWASRKHRVSIRGTQPITYHITDEFTHYVCSKWYGPDIITHLCTKEHLQEIVAASFSVWASNAPLTFLNNDVETNASIVFRSDKLLGDRIASFDIPNITVNSAHCWYEGRDWCHFVMTYRAKIIIFTSFFSFFMIIPFLSVCINCNSRNQYAFAPTFLALSTIFVHITDVIPCLYCINLHHILVHEIGHAIGI